MLKQPRFPVYVPSRDRYQEGRAMTVRMLRGDDVPFRLVVEPAQAHLYEQYVGPEDRLLVLPHNDFGLLAARNWIRAHAEAEGHARHWQLDDNISTCHRLWEGRRIPVHAGVALRVCEDFTERFSNIGISGLNYTMFVTATTPVPYYVNTHVYSCTLINHAMPYPWRLRYNDDTDLCLQALTNGWTTVLINLFTAQKTTTMTVSGGNTDSLYRDGQTRARDTAGRYEMARVLERAWPGTVKVIRRFGRYQHAVNWTKFDTALKPRPDLDLSGLPPTDEYGLVLRIAREFRSDVIRRLFAEYPDTLELVRHEPADPFWRGLPAWRPMQEPPRLAVECATEEDRERLVEQLGVLVDKKFKDKAWSAKWPPRVREYPASLRFDGGASDDPRWRYDPEAEAAA